jgi:RecA/RadA recombinase
MAAKKKEEKNEKEAAPKVFTPLTPAQKKALITQKVAAINKSFKKTVVATADKVQNGFFLRHPTGIMDLDIDLAGGFPPGVSMISGADGVGKSHLVYRTMAMHQRIYGERSAIALAAVESPIDHFFMRKLGVIIAVPDSAIEERNDWRRQHGLPAFTKDEVKELKRQVGTFLDISGADMEDTLMIIQSLLEDDKFRHPDNQFGIIAVDSLNALIPKAWAQVDLDEEQRRGAHAIAIQRFFAQTYPVWTALDKPPLYTSLLFTQQVRANSAKGTAPKHIAQYLPDATPAMGSYAARHGKLIDIHLYTGGKVKEKLSEEERKGRTAKAEITQKVLGWEITKGKAGTHEGITGEVVFDFDQEDYIDLQRTILVSGMRHGVLQEKAGKFTFVDPATGLDSEKIKDVPADELLRQLKENPEFEIEMRLSVLRAAGVECRYI